MSLSLVNVIAYTIDCIVFAPKDAYLRWNKHYFYIFLSVKGCKLGCPAGVSPVLFNVYIDDLSCEEHIRGLSDLLVLCKLSSAGM